MESFRTALTDCSNNEKVLQIDFFIQSTDFKSIEYKMKYSWIFKTRQQTDAATEQTDVSLKRLSESKEGYHSNPSRL